MYFIFVVFRTLFFFVAVNGYVNNDNLTVEKTEGERAELLCETHISTSDDVKYSWTLNSSHVSASSRRYLRGNKLIIESINRYQDIGEYVCKVRDKRKEDIVVATSIFLSVHWINDDASVRLIYPTQKLSQLQRGDNITLKCSITRSGNFKFDWTKNGERILNSDRISLENDLLHLKLASNQDNGVYRCNVSNEVRYVLSLKNFVLKLSSDENCPTLKTISEDQILKPGVDVVLNCSYENYDILDWYFKGIGPLKNDTRFLISSDGSSLRIKNIEKAYEGMYSCVGDKEKCDTYASKYTVVLLVSEFEKINKSMLEPENSNDHVIAEGKNFSIACIHPRGIPEPTITWKFPSGIVHEENDRIKITQSRLTISRAKQTDSGLYVCRAENMAGFIESSFNFTVSVTPVIIENPVSQTLLEGDNVSFSCKYKGTKYPFTKVTWLKNNIPLSINSSKIVMNEIDGSLRIDNAEVSDAAEYICVVNTSFFAPVKSGPAVLAIIQKLKFNPLPVAKKMELGLPNKIPCKAEGNDQPAVKWKKENSSGQSLPLPKHIQDINGTLYFTSVQREDEGRYTCIASNSQGVINVTIDVDVVVTPKFTKLPKNPFEGYEGYTIRFDCVAEGDPVPTIQWDSNFVDISQKRFTVLPNGSLIIDELRLSDAGIYGCTAGNSGGFNRTEVLLTVKNSEGFKADGSNDIEGDTVGRTIVITLGAAFAYILLVVVLMAWCRYRRRRKKRPPVDEFPFDHEDRKREICSELKEMSNSKQNGNVSNENIGPEYAKYLKDNYADFEFSKNLLGDLMLLGHGEFGDVFLAKSKRHDEAIVMIKVLEEMKSECNRQLDILKGFNHRHIARLMGVCFEKEPFYMILEYTDWGDLKQFLIATRKSSVRVVGNKQRPPPLTVLQSWRIVEQAALALKKLEECEYVHKDVAARNFLITSSLDVKLTFSSLCKDTYAMEYYVIRNRLLPLRWLPWEAIAYDEFSNKTDVYSFACLVWEIFMKGELPFSKLSNEEVLNLLEKRELRWKLPKSLPTMLATILEKCWSAEVVHRPTFSYILNAIDGKSKNIP